MLSLQDAGNQINPIFNPNDYIDDDYLTKAAADARYINSNQKLEQLIGSINITGDVQENNQTILGNSVIQGNNTINGKLTAINDSFSLGQTTDTTKTNIIQGNTVIGNSNIYINGGLTKLGADASNQVKSNAVTIDATSSITIGNNASSGDISMGNFTTNKIYITPKEVHLGENPNLVPYSSVDVQGTTTNINSRSNTGNVSIGNSSNNIALAGKIVNIQGNNSNSQGIVIDAKDGITTIGNSTSSTQHNVFLGYRNKIYNPQLCSQSGGDSMDMFNLNKPTFFNCFRTLQSNGALTAPSMPSMSSVGCYINTPDLTNYMIYPITFEFTYMVINGKMTTGFGNSISSLETDALTTQSSLNTGVNGTRHFYGISTLVINKTGGINGAYTFTHIPHTYSGPNSTFLGNTTSWASGSNAPAINVISFSKNANNKVQVTIQFPQYPSPLLNATTYTPVCVGFSFRLINSPSNNGGWINYAVYPSNDPADSLAGGCYLSTS